MIVYGLNPVREALRSGRVDRLTVARRHLAARDAVSAGAAGRDDNPDALVAGHPRLREILTEARTRGVLVEAADPAELDRAARGGAHQGVVAVVRGTEAWTPAELVKQASGAALLVVLDGVEDPHNLGAILRTVDAAGASGVIRQARHAAPLDGAVGRTSAGALAHVRIATVVNIARAIDELKQEGVWTVGLDERGAQAYDTVDLMLPTAVVLGAEGAGLRRLVRERCDWMVSIPMAGRISSLNVSVAAGVVLFEAARQRRAAGAVDPHAGDGALGSDR
jgi:23S rRNA (guanosine2251-2'-O)-methyltransferase